MHYQDPFRIRVRSDEIYQQREMHVPSMECGAYLLRQETVSEIDAAMILAWIPWRFSRSRYSCCGWRSRASRSARNTLSKD